MSWSALLKTSSRLYFIILKVDVYFSGFMTTAFRRILVVDHNFKAIKYLQGDVVSTLNHFQIFENHIKLVHVEKEE